MVWGVFQDKELLRREPRIRDALDWVSARHPGLSVVKQKTGTAGVYELVTGPQDDLLPETLRRVDPKGVIAQYPVAAAPTFRMDTWAIEMADVVRQGGSVDLEYGNRMQVILALLSVGWTEREVAKALNTSRTYVMRVNLAPQEFINRFEKYHVA